MRESGVRTKAFAAVAIIAALAAAWFFGGDIARSGSAAAGEANAPASVSAAENPEEANEAPAVTSSSAADAASAEAVAPVGDASESDAPARVAREVSAPPDEAPVAARDARAEDGAFSCTLSVRCDTVTDRLSALDEEKRELVPADGVIFPETTVTFYEGESVFNVLLREMKRAKIHMEFVNTPIYESAYVEGIGNLYQFDAGELSGWLYSVNAAFPACGASRLKLRDGDAVTWVYSCDLGRDVGGANAAAEQAR